MLAIVDESGIQLNSELTFLGKIVGSLLRPAFKVLLSNIIERSPIVNTLLRQGEKTDERRD